MQPITPASRPRWVTSLAIILFVMGGFAALGGLALALGGAGAMGMGTMFGPLAAVIGGALVVIALFMFIFAAVYIIAGIGLLRGRRWARTLTLVLLWIAGIANLVGFLGGLGNGNFGSALISLLFVGINALFLWKLYTDPVRAYFKGGCATPPATPAAPPSPAAPGAPTAGSA